MALRKANLWFEPDFCLARRVLDVDMWPTFLPREEVEPIATHAKYGRDSYGERYPLVVDDGQSLWWGGMSCCLPLQ